MLRQPRAPLCAPAPRYPSRRALGCWRPGQRSTEKSGNAVSFRNSLAFYLLHHFANCFVDLSHVISAWRFAQWEGNELLNPGELFAHIFDQWLAAQLRRDFVNFRLHEINQRRLPQNFRAAFVVVLQDRSTDNLRAANPTAKT